MQPKTHFYIGLGIGVVLLPFIPWYYILVIITANVLIDFDHYMVAVIRNKGDCRLSKALEYFNTYRADFCLFHTIEFHLLVLLMTILNIFFFYVFIGMVIHSISDFIPIAYTHRLKDREYWFWRWYKNDRKI